MYITQLSNCLSLPEWAERHKEKGIAIEERNGRYYAYRIHSVWDPEKRRSRKVTDEYLGVVRPEGIIPPKHKRRKEVGPVIEAGNIIYLERFANMLIKPLQEFWPESWQSILAAGVLKLAYREPLKRLSFRYQTSYACRLWPDAHLSKNSLTSLLEMLGLEWGCQRSFFEELSRADSNMAIDLTQVFSDSENISWLEKGYNHQGSNHEQLQLLLLWGVDTHLPGFLRLLPGTASSAQNLINAVVESRLRNVIVIGDKAFFSTENVDALEFHEVNYALALPRDLEFLEHPPPSRYRRYFLHKKSPQWWREYEWGERRVVHYLDKQLAAQEEASFLGRVEQGKAKKKDHREKKNTFGTLAILTDTGKEPKELYELYKQRREIEQCFDSLKNTLDADKTWMQSREKLQGYLFILFIAFHIYSQVLLHLHRKELNEKYSVHDVLWYLTKAYIVPVDGRDIVSENLKSTRKLVAELEVPITQKLGN